MPKDIKAGIWGLITGDALGVPVEFLGREQLRKAPLTQMVGYGTHQQPPGTWSDDSSLALCLADVLAEGYDLQRLAQSFVGWYYEADWTPHGEVFDVGIATRQAIGLLQEGIAPELAGGTDERSNGNGSLMRILPLLYYSRHKDLEQRFELARSVSSLTHGHIRSVLACFYYLELARLLAADYEKRAAYLAANELLAQVVTHKQLPAEEVRHFERLSRGDIDTRSEDQIRGSGYVIHALEASVWCLLTSTSYTEAVLKGINLGEDTDTTGAITGGLAGLYFGLDQIPPHWLAQLARADDIRVLISRLEAKYGA